MNNDSTFSVAALCVCVIPTPLFLKVVEMHQKAVCKPPE